MACLSLLSISVCLLILDVKGCANIVRFVQSPMTRELETKRSESDLILYGNKQPDLAKLFTEITKMVSVEAVNHAKKDFQGAFPSPYLLFQGFSVSNFLFWPYLFRLSVSVNWNLCYLMLGLTFLNSHTLHVLHMPATVRCAGIPVACHPFLFFMLLFLFATLCACFCF